MLTSLISSFWRSLCIAQESSAKKYTMSLSDLSITPRVNMPSSPRQNEGSEDYKVDRLPSQIISMESSVINKDKLVDFTSRWNWENWRTGDKTNLLLSIMSLWMLVRILYLTRIVTKYLLKGLCSVCALLHCFYTL